MTLIAALGHAQALNGREAGLQAVHHALNRLGASTPNFGIVIASHQYQPREVAAGVASLTGEMPLIGFSAPAGLTQAEPEIVAPAPATRSKRAPATPGAGDALAVSELWQVTEEARVYVELGHHDRAIEALQEHIRKLPRSVPAAWLMLLGL